MNSHIKQLIVSLAFTALLLLLSELVIQTLDFERLYVYIVVFVVGYSLKAAIEYAMNRNRESTDNN